MHDPELVYSMADGALPTGGALGSPWVTRPPSAAEAAAAATAAAIPSRRSVSTTTGAQLRPRLPETRDAAVAATTTASTGSFLQRLRWYQARPDQSTPVGGGGGGGVEVEEDGPGIPVLSGFERSRQQLVALERSLEAIDRERAAVSRSLQLQSQRTSAAMTRLQQLLSEAQQEARDLNSSVEPSPDDYAAAGMAPLAETTTEDPRTTGDPQPESEVRRRHLRNVSPSP